MNSITLMTSLRGGIRIHNASFAEARDNVKHYCVTKFSYVSINLERSITNNEFFALRELFHCTRVIDNLRITYVGEEPIELDQVFFRCMFHQEVCVRITYFNLEGNIVGFHSMFFSKLDVKFLAMNVPFSTLNKINFNRAAYVSLPTNVVVKYGMMKYATYISDDYCNISRIDKALALEIDQSNWLKNL